MVELPSPTTISPVSTGPDGSFRLRGHRPRKDRQIARGRADDRDEQLHVVTRPGKTIGSQPRQTGRTTSRLRFTQPRWNTLPPRRDPSKAWSSISTRANPWRASWSTASDHDATVAANGAPRRSPTIGAVIVCSACLGAGKALVAIPPIDIPYPILKKAGPKVPRPEDLPYLRAGWKSRNLAPI